MLEPATRNHVTKESAAGAPLLVVPERCQADLPSFNLCILQQPTMPRPARVGHLPVPVTISSLLAPQYPAGPLESLPTPSAAVLGPLPPTTPLHLALNWLALTDLPEYQPDVTSQAVPALGGSSRAYPRGAEGDPGGHGSKVRGVESSAAVEKARTAGARAMVITGSKEGYYKSLEEEDEDWMRDHGGDYEVLRGLNRIDMR